MNKNHLITEFLLLFCVLALTFCRSNPNGPNLEPNTDYSGTFTIKQINEEWKGTVTLNLDQDTFVQEGTIENVSTGKSQHIHNEGDLHIYADSVEFNKQLENLMPPIQNWVMVGKFAYTLNHGKLKLSQSYSHFSYIISLDGTK